MSYKTFIPSRLNRYNVFYNIQGFELLKQFLQKNFCVILKMSEECRKMQKVSIGKNVKKSRRNK